MKYVFTVFTKPATPPGGWSFLCNKSNTEIRITKDNVITIVQDSEFENLKSYLDYGISLYTISYNTTYKGQNIKASGLVAFPDTDKGMPILNFNHGTTSLHADAPTEDLIQYSFFSNAASAGYIVVIPDYLGFGVSDDIVHPYYRSDIHGIDFNRHNKYHLIKSVLEGVSFSLSYGIELLRDMGIEVNTVKVGNQNLFKSKIFRKTFR